ncbi:MAG: DNA mismatch endonuclease Vsr [Chloroflexota bacterium]|nr:DNA mismatch endonuclease Vsr [Chloroflexota bacterium]
MPDVYDTQTRSRVMRSVKSRDTKPEMRVRRTLHAMGYRFRLHRGDLPGKPDITLPRYRTVLFVHGCFWHQHEACERAERPTSNTAYWQKKLSRNVERDYANRLALEVAGWYVVTVWECEIDSAKNLADLLTERLTNQRFSVSPVSSPASSTGNVSVTSASR